ncbi:VCBS repeat-containing protein [Acidobacteria bacterium AB60]|nr:VCBS repeat-containing protein [Acidobacteria bacterium AB60]
MLRYSSALCALGAVVSFSPCFGQNQASFQSQTMTVPSFAFVQPTTIAVDLNNDGIPDLIELTQNGPLVYLAKGDGTFTPGYSYSFPSGNSTGGVTGDFNGDGKADLIIPIGANQVDVFLGNGDGTFQPPVAQTFAAAGTAPYGSSIAAADINHDGKLDLILPVTTSNGVAIAVALGNGNGTFADATTVVNANNVAQVATGDFDGDSIADIAFIDNTNCTSKNCASVVHVLYGRGDGTFIDTTPLTAPNYIYIGTGDLNSDGRTDLFTVMNEYTSTTTVAQLATLYGQTDRTFALYTQNIDNSQTGVFGQYAMADFNGDGKMDIVAISTYDGAILQFRFLLATSSLGAFTEQDINYTNQVIQMGNPVVGNFVKEPYARPSALFIGSAVSSTSTTESIYEARNITNGGFWGGCAFPAAGQGINLCSPTTVPAGSPFVVDASANSFGSLRKMELWVDGKKIGEQYHTWEQRAWSYFSNTYAAGNHSGALFAVDIDNHLQQYNFSFTVGSAGACAPPSSAGIHVCSPTNGGTTSSPVQASAAATVTGTIQRMEVWVDYVKQYSTFGVNTLNTSLNLAAGQHRFDYFAVNTAGQKWQSTLYTTVQ